MLPCDWLSYYTLSIINVQWLEVTVVDKMATFSRFSEVSFNPRLVKSRQVHVKEIKFNSTETINYSLSFSELTWAHHLIGIFS